MGHPGTNPAAQGTPAPAATEAAPSAAVEAFVFHCDYAPAGQDYLARLRGPMRGAKGKAVIDWHPIFFMAATPKAARERALTWWAGVLETERKKVANAAAAGGRAKARASTKAEVAS